MKNATDSSSRKTADVYLTKSELEYLASLPEAEGLQLAEERIVARQELERLARDRAELANERAGLAEQATQKAARLRHRADHPERYNMAFVVDPRSPAELREEAALHDRLARELMTLTTASPAHRAMPAPRPLIHARPRGHSPRPQKSARVSSGGGCDDPSPAEPPKPRPGQPVGAPLLVSDRSAFALIGLNPRPFRTFVRERGLQTSKVGRRTVVRADVLLEALGLADVPATETAKPAVDWRARATLRLVAGGNRGGQ